MNSKYNEDDLIKIIKNEATEIEMAHKYGTSYQSIKKAMYRFGYRKHKSIKISSPYQPEIYVDDVKKCADELGVSRPTIYKALRGEKVKVLDEMKIKIEYAEVENYD